MKRKKLKYTAGFDGSAMPNPGQMRIGGWIRKPKNNILIHSFSTDIGHGSSCEAEYLALITLLKKIKNLKIKNILIIGDNLPIIEQVTHKAKAKNVITQKYRDIALQLFENENWLLKHVHRYNNIEAHNLTQLKYKKKEFK